MSQVGIVRENAILPFKAAIDLTGKEGYPVIVTGQNEITLLTNAEQTPFGVLLKGGKAGEQVTVAPARGGFSGTVRVKLFGPVTQTGTLLGLFEDNDEVAFVASSDAPTTPRVAMALEGGVAEEKIEAVLIAP